MARTHIEQKTFIALYNIDKKELFAVFENKQKAKIYLYKSEHRKKGNAMESAWRKGHKIHNSIHPFAIAVRTADKKYHNLLNEDGIWIHSDYPAFKPHEYKGFNSSREEWKMESAQRRKSH